MSAKRAGLGATLLLVAAAVFGTDKSAGPTLDTCATDLRTNQVHGDTPSAQMDATYALAETCINGANLPRGTEKASAALEQATKKAGLNPDTSALFQIAGLNLGTQRSLAALDYARKTLDAGLNNLKSRIGAFLND